MSAVSYYDLLRRARRQLANSSWCGIRNVERYVMPTDVLMPKLADTLVEGTVAHWLKAANDVVQAGEPIVEIETDKVTTELTAPTAGTLSELLVAAGETVPNGCPLAPTRSQDEKATAKRVSPLAARVGQAHVIGL